MTAWTQALSTALVDFLWQGALVGMLLWLALTCLRSRSAAARYTASCVALAALALLPLFTLMTFWSMAGNAPAAAQTATDATSAPSPAMPQTMLQIWFVPEAPRMAWLEQLQQWALPVWSLGVLLLSVRLIWGYAHSLALQRAAGSSDETALTRVTQLAGRIGITRSVRVLVSSLADGPSVVGWLRPAILLPPAAAMGLTPEQLEAVLAHELAHVKRHDYLINMFQIIAETLFFYHPVVWWVSKQMRIERELCCDDIAVRSCGDAVGYARALTTLARQRLSAPEVAIAATGGSLKYRVQRLLGATPKELGAGGAPGAVVLAIAVAAIVLNLDRLQARAQSPTEPLRFEVASIKRNTLNDRIVVSQFQNGRLSLRGHTLGMLITSAYRVQEFQIADVPDWIDTDRFDILATAPSNAPGIAEPAGPVAPGPGEPTRRDRMLRALLEDRFRLSVHKETRERPVFALVPARRDGRLGPALKPTSVDCATANGLDSCGTSVGPGYIRVRGVTMAQLATAFSRLSFTGSSLNRLVVDRSRLEGRYDAELKFTPEFIPSMPPGGLPSSMPSPDPNGPSIFTAVQEQLGLKLDPQRGPVEVLVIDRVERPSEN
jgi:uncharacterized protein (TIGR03435 family)